MVLYTLVTMAAPALLLTIPTWFNYQGQEKRSKNSMSFPDIASLLVSKQESLDSVLKIKTMSGLFHQLALFWLHYSDVPVMQLVKGKLKCENILDFFLSSSFDFSASVHYPETTEQ